MSILGNRININNVSPCKLKICWCSHFFCFLCCTYLAVSVLFSLSYSELISAILLSFSFSSIISSHERLRAPSIFSLAVHIAGRLSAVNMAQGRPLMFNSYEDQLWPSLMSQFLDTAVNFTENKRPRRYKIDLQRHLSFVTSNLCILWKSGVHLPRPWSDVCFAHDTEVCCIPVNVWTVNKMPVAILYSMERKNGRAFSPNLVIKLFLCHRKNRLWVETRVRSRVWLI